METVAAGVVGGGGVLPAGAATTAGEGGDTLLLDAEIRNYVLLPILILMILVTYLRNEVMVFFHSPATTDLKKIRENQLLTRARRFRGAGSRLAKESYDRRRVFYVDREKGILTKKSIPPPNDTGLPNLANNPMMDPNNMGAMMKGQAAMIFSQMI